ncbi:MAG: beta-lactamase family protein [Anaerolineaceae bacterium]|nr:MAG: beta-lactamase family protein [Anaerolineaceae bacterium]
MSYIRFKNRLFLLIVIIIGALFMTACSALEKAEFAGMEAAAGTIEADTWDDLLVNFTTNPFFCDAPGAVLLVDTPQGRFLEGTGVSSVEEETPMQVSDAFEIGSITKSFTVAVALQLQEEGVWSLDDPLAQWLPEMAAQVPNGDQMTLRQLANNNTGIWDYGDPLLEAGAADTSLRQKTFSPEEIITYALENGEPQFDPGQDWSYSSTNFVLLGMALEAVTGQSMAELYQTRIFTPLGMANTTLPEGVPEEGLLADGYFTAESEDDEEAKLVNATDWNVSQGWTAGAIVSTAEDMALYTEALASGALFSDPDSLAEMIAFQEVDPIKFGLMTGYGLGVGVMPLDAAEAWGHTGGTTGYATLIMTIPEKETNVVYLTNSADCNVALLPSAINEPLLDG